MKILIVGMGGIGQRHVRNLRTLLGSDIEILAYRVRRLLTSVTEKLEVEPGVDVEKKYSVRVFNDLNEALSQNPDIAFICNPSSLHIPIALQIAERGCHLFIEKPLSNNFKNVKKLVSIIEQKKLVSLVGYQLRFHPCIQKLKSIIDCNYIGKILSVRAQVGEYLPAFHKYEDYRQMYASRIELGGGVVLSQIHELDYLYWLFGLPHRIFALGGHLSSLEIDVEDIASILMEFNYKDAIFPVHLHMDYVQRPPSRTCDIIGDKGKVNVDLHANTLKIYGEDGNEVEDYSFDKFNRNQMFLDELNHFLSCIQNKQKSIVTVYDGSQSLRLALMIKESIQTGRIIQVGDSNNGTNITE
jgi:predicted dehydrogenase